MPRMKMLIRLKYLKEHSYSVYLIWREPLHPERKRTTQKNPSKVNVNTKFE
uniref:Uncharacterized protein At2g34800 n=1 Tax=Arabidopsis thaliana TaxID=3702 RepID=O64744_ARATH|nr:hypothetical protein [Arabidopsis thaliana]